MPFPTSRISPRPSSKRSASGSSKSPPESSKPKAGSASPSPQHVLTPPCSAASRPPYSQADHDLRGNVPRQTQNLQTSNPKISRRSKRNQAPATGFVPQKRTPISKGRCIGRASVYPCKNPNNALYYSTQFCFSPLVEYDIVLNTHLP